mgnify:CR=1 FL=1|jgi:uncharacterized membrane protein
MSEITLAALLWVGTHLGLSSTVLRDKLVNITGAQGFLGLYSIVAAASLGYLIYIYTIVGRYDYFWLPNPDLFWVSKLLMPIAFILMLGGFMVKNPTMVGATLEADEAESIATGVTRITRHPFQWGVVLWAGSHMVANGDWVSWVFFGSFALISSLGCVLMDRKKANTMGDGWQTYANVTSNVPFAAILSGRNRLVLKELVLPIVVGSAVYALVYYFHEAMTGTVVI